RGGRRLGAARACLRPAMQRPNLAGRTRAHATRILFEGRRAVGIRYRQGGADREVRARREVILSGGSVNSPQLLQVSGVGPADLLRDIGVPVLHALPGVGENLRDHYPVRVVGRVKGVDSINERSRGLRLVKEVLDYAVRRQGILTLQPTLAYCFWMSNPAIGKADLQ